MTPAVPSDDARRGAAGLEAPPVASGHTVLLVQVPALEPVVRPPLRRWAPAFLMPDGEPNAHVTVLSPFLEDPTDALPELTRLCASVAPFEVTFRRLGRFAHDGLVYAVPEPETPFRTLTSLVTSRWPECPPYGGRFGDVVPHLSIDHAGSTAELEPLVASYLPVRSTVRELTLVRYAPGDMRVLARLPLASG